MLEQGAVYAIASAVEQPEYVDIDEPSTSGRALGILKDSPTSLITEDMLPGIRAMYGIPSDVELRASKEYERADWDIPRWTCLYEYTFRLGFRFPIPQLVRRMLVYYELAPEVGGAGKAPECGVAPERTRILLEIPTAQRSVSNLLTEVTTMASAEINIPDNAETLRRYKEEFARKRAAARRKGKLLRSRLEKKAASSSKDKSTGSDFEPDSSMKLLASGLSSFKDPAGFLKRSDDFTLVDDDMHLKKVKTEEVFDTLLLSNFQAYQATLHLHGRYKAINDKSVALRKVGDALKAENAKLSTEKSLVEQQKVALEDELKNERARHQAEVARLNEAAGQQDKTIEALRERALSIAVEAVCKTRAELFKEYLSGDHSKWNPQTMQEEIDMYEEMQRLKLEESQGVGVDRDVQNVDENLGDDASLDKDDAAATDGPPQDGL
ncbi:hypothetical protein Q3G72_021088 [Acer saccharum]|nr:hypothetical protein Q3G72_021088 [Acer saccharum]